MKAAEFNIPKEKFSFAQNNKSLHDKELITKPKSYLRDAFDRFCRNKGSIFAAIVIALLGLFAIFGPIFSQFNVQYTDTYYRFVLPKNPLFENTNFWDGCSSKSQGESTFIYYYSQGVETGHKSIKNDQYYVSTSGKNLMYNFRLDSYHSIGTVFKTGVSFDEYKAIQKYQDDNEIQIIYPITDKTKRPIRPVDENNANFWYEIQSDFNKTTPINYEIKDDGTVEFKGNIYLPYDGTDEYTSKMRIEGSTPKYNYAYETQGRTFEIRVNYYEYYKYYHSEILKDGIYEPVFLFGTTDNGQDLFTCLAAGARFSFIFAIAVSVVNMVVGAIYGAIEGYYGGKADIIMERIVEILSAVPTMIVITLMRYHWGKNLSDILILFICFFATGWIGMSGTVRMQFYRFKNQEYVLASRTLGARDPRIMFKHIFPNSLGTIVTSSVLVIPGMIFSETSLSYLGIINLADPAAGITSVGTLLASGQPYLTTFPHLIIFPAIFISLLMLCFNLFGNGLRDAFNPSLRGTED